MDEIVPIFCPKCRKEMRKALSWLEHYEGSPIVCPCGAQLGDYFAEVVRAIKESKAREAEHFDKLKREFSGKRKRD